MYDKIVEIDLKNFSIEQRDYYAIIGLCQNMKDSGFFTYVYDGYGKIALLFDEFDQRILDKFNQHVKSMGIQVEVTI